MKMIHWTMAILFGMVITSCTLSKTDYEAELSTAIPETTEFEEAFSINSNGYQIRVNALGGTFYKGYNELHFEITETATQEAIANATVTLLPIRTTTNAEAYSCPHSEVVAFQTTDAYYEGYSVFDVETDTDASWVLYLSITVAGETFNLEQPIEVAEQENLNLNMTSFTGNDGVQYYIALIAPVSPSVAENELIAGVYQYNEPETAGGDFPDPSQFSFSEVEGATLLLDPRMPEPNMGNHSSPNNEDLTQEGDGLYYGVVNYTMTGNWTLNFIFQNAAGDVIKGTEVPTDFTPGVEGEKSELYIDILF
ncbi:hypothetical protein SAMN05216480_10254 [Pustulibacterium marinum]|uniref:YtkA-like n=1 Tax=Pustulibacterium marinum TaxID=1224947 RepID=A0A1I7FNN4_9FLAO|nr:hypothetical protein [Pustulibacterium marinum]SFU37636.1 hypothetical protein SAMN05216480_10254 [Pustulibacterium marinum]